jgi:hypothetical protein
MVLPASVRLAVTSVAGLLLGGLFAAPPEGALATPTVAAATPTVAAAPPAEQRNTNSTGTNAGSLPNGVGNLKVSLAATPDGRIRVSWKRPGPVRNLKKFVVRVGPSRNPVARVVSHEVSPKQQSLVVRHAVDAVPASGNYTFVRVRAYRKHGGYGSSPGKWIQAPVTTVCTAAAEDRLTVGSFNLRTWAADKSKGRIQKWSARGPNAVSEILRSGAHAVAIQEASGGANPSYGGTTQDVWVLDQLNRNDPDHTARWVDALDKKDYKPPMGRKPGLVGTRVFYDASKFTKLAAGLHRLIDPKWHKDSLVPWARLRSTTGDQASFVLTSSHLRVGPDRAPYATRVRQTTQLLATVEALRARFGDTVIVAGDLNSTANQLPVNYVQRELLRHGMYDAYATTDLVGAQYPSTNASKYPVPQTPLRRDYILTYGPVKGSCSYVNRTYQERAQEASDHFMQVATLPLPPA